MFRFKSPVAIGTLFFAICFLIVGCSSDSGGTATPTSPTSASASASAPAAPALNLAGTWRGTFRAPGESECCAISWTATQSGASVSGPVSIAVGEGGIVLATLTGTVSGAQLTSATFTVAAGAIGDLPTCSIRGTGTLAASADSVSGPLAIVISPATAPCVGGDDEGISRTATDTWTFSLTK